jgi:diguanylate cyclase (GGDEF)-like protein
VSTIFRHTKPSFERSVILVLSSVGALAVLPFAVIRLLNHDWPIGLIDLSVTLVFSAIFGYVWLTGRTTVAGIILALFFLFTAMVTVYLKGPDQTAWLYPSMVGVFFLVGGRLGIVANLLVVLAVCLLIYPQVSALKLVTLCITAVTTNAFAYVFAVLNDKQKQQLSELARRDSLTQLLNRRAFDEELNALVLQHQRELGANRALILLDIDHFKSVNDELGHDEGDRVLMKLALIIKSRLRKTDRFFRIGGEEFAIIPFETSPQAAEQLAEDIRQRIEAMQDMLGRRITVSLGVAHHRPHQTTEQWFKSADELLYRAKRGGRNQVCCDRQIEREGRTEDAL